MDKNVFFEKYASLPDNEKELLQLVTLLYEPVSKTTILDCAKKCQIISGSRISMQKIIKRVTENSLSKDPKSGKFIILESAYVKMFTEYCLQNPNFKYYWDIINDMFPIVHPHAFFERILIHRVKREFYAAFFQNKQIETINYYNMTRDNDSNISALDLFLKPLTQNNCFNTAIADLIPEKVKSEIIIHASFSFLESPEELFSIMKYVKKDKKLKKDFDFDFIYRTIAENFLEKERFSDLKKLLKKYNFSIDFYTPSLEFIEGRIEKAYKLYMIALEKTLGKSKRAYCPDGLPGEYLCFTLIALGKESGKLFQSIITKGIKEKRDLFFFLKALCLSQQGKEQEVDKILYTYRYDSTNTVNSLFAKYFIDKNKIDSLEIEKVQHYFHTFISENRLWSAYRYYSLLKALNKTDSFSRKEKTKMKKLSNDFLDMTTILKEQSDWEKAILKLKNISKQNKKGTITKNISERLIWLVGMNKHEIGIIEPKEQKIKKNGGWSKGRKVALKRIRNKELKSMTLLDKQIGSCIDEEFYTSWGYNYDAHYILDKQKAVPYLIEHPYLFLSNSPNTKLELTKEKLQLIVKKKQKTFQLSLSQKIKKTGYKFVRETASKYKVYEITETHLNIAKSLGKKQKLTVPKSQEKELQNIIAGISSILPVHSDIKGAEMTGREKIKTVKADSTPHIHLLPVNDGIRAELFVKPFKTGGSFFKPAYGGKNVIAEIKGKQQQATRNLTKEKELSKNVLEKCPSLAIRGKYNDIFEFDTAHEALDALLELQDIKNDIKIHWPEGEKLRIIKKYRSNDLNISVRKNQDWFKLSGQIDIDGEQVMQLQELLRKPLKSNFIELKDGEFIALTEDLKEKIKKIAGLSFPSKNETKIHSLNASYADEILSEIGKFKSNKIWKEHVKKAQKADEFKPTLPSTLQAELRPYQLEGFNWISQLAHWNVGACLADDMGLGKTIQALAIILERAKNGPTLVVAPASVCHNWIAESAKFAPTLNPLFFGTGNREENIKDLKPFDLILCTYGLLHSEEKNLAKVNWTTTVLDEAQYIKNYKAKRSKAAFKLKSDFRLITTGTPIENHLSELWSLFAFLNPGFLGTQKEFTEKFANPIEKEKDPDARKALKKMIKPFILRRLKTQVLDDLPEKTEITLTIELSEKEKAFYEALRQNSVNNIEKAKEEKGSGAIHLQILAELTKLRQACCHSSMVSDKINIESSKLNHFIRIVEELKENNHKALIFSQFTKHLAILKKECDKRNISYQYLDGTTPTKKRQKLVDAFQAGNGDIFLISLKAGGTGLNLTAADYVVHMDPWWNPAVEDQASDRAHRIGQQRPVTVYRFVTKDTVEEKIIALHKTKRKLADSLLDGTNVTGKISANDLLNLLK
ncbi:MAG: DEAD/DEAH box helicase [Verrucomicrobiota bacterium]|nr:DEAD/DEAH box helicase [Verrucomicrobiota bacterium]